MSRRANDLSAPRGGRRLSIHYDPERFGRFSETIAHYLGTASYLVIQSVVIVIWVALNVLAYQLRWDPYPFILLTLVLSMQASYAAPLILLAQNRQADRDGLTSESDREVNARTLADTGFLSRELVSVRLALAELPTEQDISREISRLAAEIDALRADVAKLSARSASRARKAT